MSLVFVAIYEVILMQDGASCLTYAVNVYPQECTICTHKGYEFNSIKKSYFYNYFTPPNQQCKLCKPNRDSTCLDPICQLFFFYIYITFINIIWFSNIVGLNGMKKFLAFTVNSVLARFVRFCWYFKILEMLYFLCDIRVFSNETCSHILRDKSQNFNSKL